MKISLKVSLFVMLLICTGNIFAKDKRTVFSINAVGDMMMGTKYPHDTLPPGGGATVFAYIKPFLTQGSPDIVFGNLEGCLTTYSRTWKNVSSGRSWAFQMPPSYTRYLLDAGFNMLSTANNHVFDFGKRGYNDTRKYLLKAGLDAFGSKNEILRKKINGKWVAFIGFCWNPSLNSILKVKTSMKLIRKAAKNSDIVVVSIHGGSEGEIAVHVKNKMEYFGGSRRGNMVKFSHDAIDNGADLIIGHGPHLPRAMEVYKNRLIAYSLGNFATYKMFITSGYRKLTMVLNVELDAEGALVQGKIIPMIQIPSGRLRGIPRYDMGMRVIRHVRRMTKLDFPGNTIDISENGIITTSSPKVVWRNK